MSRSNLQRAVVNRDKVVPYLQNRLPAFQPTGSPTRLPEGNLNVVWRVPGEERSVIVKYAPPYVAADPDVPLDPSRLVFEARCLQALGPEGRLHDVTRSSIRPPRPLHVDAEKHVLVMEDVGDVPTLGRWLRGAGDEERARRAPDIGRTLGRFLGRLHRRTMDDEAYKQAHTNQPVQETRYAIQYQAVADLLERGGVADADELGARARDLGERLLKPGRCLTMGDLWPPSVLVLEDGLRLIDWELSHFGHPAQDVAHFAAHLWMHAHRAPSEPVAGAAKTMWRRFLSAYRETLGSIGRGLVSRRDGSIHAGAEILVRTVGRFQDGSLYEGLSPTDEAVQEAVHAAARLIRNPDAEGGIADVR